MKRLVCILAFVVATSAALAQAGPQSLALTCQSARQIVASRGAVVLYTGASTYDRYVTGTHFCAYDEVAQPATIPTADIQQCFVGYRCVGSDIAVRGD